MAVVFVALGSNLGDRESFLDQALNRLRNLPQTKIVRSSRWYETEPVGGPPQGMFLNGVVELETSLSPMDLFHQMKKIEMDCGRPSEHQSSEPRVIDLDLLFYDDRIIKTPELTVPHPRLHEREFVLLPLTEIAPTWVHPQIKKSAQELLSDLYHENCPKHFAT